MGDFADIQKKLDIYPSRKVTSAEIAAYSTTGSKLSKYDGTYRKSRNIKKVPTVIRISQDYTISSITTTNYPRLAFQWNLTVGKAFSFLNSFDFFRLRGCIRSGFLCVKWLHDNITYRRILLPRTIGLFFYPPYTNELIQSNFVIEYWQIYDIPGEDVGISFSGLNFTSFPFELSLLNTPSSADETERTVDIGTPKYIDEIGFSLPAAMPISNTTIYHANN